MASKFEQMLIKRSLREREYGVTNYELQAMLEVDHADWPKHSEEIALREREGIDYTPDEAEFAITLIHKWVKEDGAEEVRRTLTDTIAHRAALAAA